MKKLCFGLLVLFLAFILLFSAGCAEGASVVKSGTVGGMSWTLNSEGLLTISGKGLMPFFSRPSGVPDSMYSGTENCPWRNLAVKKVVIEEGVTGIGTYAFSLMSSLESVEIPSTVKSIYSYAFYNCTALTGVSIPAAVDNTGADIQGIFYGCTNLRNLTLEDGIAGLGTNAFYGCTALETVEIPGSLKNLTGTFNSCTGLTNVTISEGVKTMYRTFSHCRNLASVSLPGTLTEIGETFNGCTSLTEVTIPASVATMGNTVFSGCTKLKTVRFEGALPSIPSSGTSTRREVFRDVTATVYCHCPTGKDTWTTIVQNNPTSFGGTITWCRYGECNDGITWTLEDGVLNVMGSGILSEPGWTSKMTISRIVLDEGITGVQVNLVNSESLTAICLPKQLETLDETVLTGFGGDLFASLDGSAARLLSTMGYSFYDPDYPELKLKYAEENGQWKLHLQAAAETGAAVTVPEGVTDIDDRVFQGRNNLETVVLPSTVERIGTRAFSNAAGLAGINLPEGLESIGSFAFSGCRALYLEELPESLLSVGCGAFENVRCKAVRITAAMNLEAGAFRYSRPDIVTVAEGVSSLQAMLFYGSGITSVSLPEGLAEIGESTFADCTSLTNLVLPSSVTLIGSNAFSGCSTLELESLPISLKTICQNAFYGCSLLNLSAFPEQLESIGDHAFAYCSGITSIRLNTSLQLDGNAFQGCENLSSLLLEGEDPITAEWTGSLSTTQVTSLEISGPSQIGGNAFLNWESLRDVTLGESVKNTAAGCFAGCGQNVGLTVTMDLVNLLDFMYREEPVGDRYYHCTSHLFGNSMENVTTMTVMDGNRRIVVDLPSVMATPTPSPVPTATPTPTPAVTTPPNPSITINLTPSMAGEAFKVDVPRGTDVIFKTGNYLTYHTIDRGTRQEPPRHPKYNSFYTSLGNTFTVNTNKQQDYIGVVIITLSYTTIPDENGTTCYILGSIQDTYGVALNLIDPDPTPTPSPTPTPTPEPTSVPTPKASADFKLDAGYPSWIAPSDSVLAIGSDSFATLEIISGGASATQSIVQSYGVKPFVTLDLGSVSDSVILLNYSLYEPVYGSYRTVWQTNETTQMPERIIVQEALPGEKTGEGTMVIRAEDQQPLQLPGQLTRIEEEAFSGLQMRWVILPASCQSIGSRAFADCGSLMSVRMGANVEFMEDTFAGDPLLVIHAPAGGRTQELALEYGIPFAAE